MQEPTITVERPEQEVSHLSALPAWRSCALIVAGVISFAALVWDPTGMLPLLTFILLTACAVAVEWLFSSPSHVRGPYLSAPFLTAGVLLLPSPPLALLVAAIYLAQWARKRAAFTGIACRASATLVGVALAYFLNSWITVGSAQPFSGMAQLLGALSVAATLTLVYPLLTAIDALPMGRVTVSVYRLFNANSLITRFVIFLIGLPIAVFWTVNPWLVALAFAPLLLVHRTLNVPMLEKEARTDTKTGLHNMRSFNEAFSREVQRASRFGHPVSVLMIDVDLLRHVNNAYGHQAGDSLLRGIADALLTQVREYDVAARFGGDEFVCLLVECDGDTALQVAERIRRLVEGIEFEVPTSVAGVGATVSVGVASFPRHGTSTEEIIYQADLAVYRAKLGGRNRVCLAPPPNRPVPCEAPAAPRPAGPAESPWDSVVGADGTGSTLSPAMSSAGAKEQDRRSGDGPPADLEGRRSKGVPPRLRLLMGVVIGLALALCIIGSQDLAGLDWVGLLSLVLLTLAAEAWAIDLYGESTISLMVIPIITVAMLFGVPGGVIVGLVAGIARGVLRRSQLYKIAFNTAVFVVGASIAGTVFRAFGAPLRPDALPLLLAPTVAAALMYFVVNTSLISLAMGLSSNRNPALIWREQFRWLLVHYVVFGLLGLFLATAYDAFGLFGLLAFVAPALGMRYAMHQYISNTTEHVSELRRLNAEMQRSNDEMARINEDLLNTLAAAIDVRDPYVYGHSTKVAEYAVAIAQEMRLSGELIELIRQAGLLHDIGKLGIAEAILHKPAKLDPAEYETVKRHAMLGADLLTKMRRLQHLIPAIKHHHEWYNGGGYPVGLAGAEIPVEARILAVCDAIEAMASDRPYHEAMPVDLIVAELQRCAGSQFDPAVVQAFVRVTITRGEAFVSNSALAIRQRDSRPPSPNGHRNGHEPNKASSEAVVLATPLASTLSD